MKTNFLRVLFLTFIMLFVHTYSSAQQEINSDLHVYGIVKMISSYGYLTMGSIDANYVRLNTDKSAFYFNKPLVIQSSIKTTGRAFFFYTNTNTQCLTMLDNRVGIGTINPRYSLDVKGSIGAKTITVDSILRAEEIIVETTGADFVFADDYRLRPLSEVEAFITENKHLPEIQSAQEMQEKGVSVSELQTQLLQKIEELTLYLIQQEQTIQELRKEVELLKK